MGSNTSLHATCTVTVQNLKQSTDGLYNHHQVVNKLQENDCSSLEALPVPVGNRPVSRHPETGGQVNWLFAESEYTQLQHCSRKQTILSGVCEVYLTVEEHSRDHHR